MIESTENVNLIVGQPSASCEVYGTHLLQFYLDNKEDEMYDDAYWHAFKYQWSRYVQDYSVNMLSLNVRYRKLLNNAKPIGINDITLVQLGEKSFFIKNDGTIQGVGLWGYFLNLISFLQIKDNLEVLDQFHLPTPLPKNIVVCTIEGGGEIVEVFTIDILVKLISLIQSNSSHFPDWFELLNEQIKNINDAIKHLWL